RFHPPAVPVSGPLLWPRGRRAGPGGRRTGAAAPRPPGTGAGGALRQRLRPDRPFAARERRPAGWGQLPGLGRRRPGGRTPSSRHRAQIGWETRSLVSTLRRRVLTFALGGTGTMTSTALAMRPTELMLAGPLGSLDHYIQAANAIPVLTAEEEVALARRLRDTNDLEAAKRLVLSHLRFVVHVARGYAGYGLQLGDL